METGTIIALGISLLALIVNMLSFRRNTNQDTSATAAERATLTANVNYIRQSIDEIKLENRAIQQDIVEIKARIVKAEESAKSAHKRLDDMTRKEHGSDD
jgi:predicted  nucleic acid-binding Zn-ribbon protein